MIGRRYDRGGDPYTGFLILIGFTVGFLIVHFALRYYMGLYLP